MLNRLLDGSFEGTLTLVQMGEDDEGLPGYGAEGHRGPHRARGAPEETRRRAEYQLFAEH